MNEPGLRAAAAAGAVPVAFLGDNTRHHDVSAAQLVAGENVMDIVETLIRPTPALAA